MLRLFDLTICYGKAQVVHQLNLEVPDRQVVALLGSNGAGKTTILKTISGILHPKSGSIVADGKDISRFPPHVIVRGGVVHCPEGRQIFPDLTVHENLMMGAYARGSLSEIEFVFALFPALKNRLRQLGGTLSGGEQQMLAIGRALMARPRLLMLDEPSLGLAPVIVEQVFAAVLELREKGLSILLVEQNAMLALDVCDYAYILARGKISLEGRPQSLYGSGILERSYLGAP